MAVPSSTTLFIIIAMSEATCGGMRLGRLLGVVAVEAPDGFAGARAHLQDGMRLHRLALVREGRIGDGVLEHGHLVGADRQRGRVGQRRLDAHAARGLR